MCGLRTLPLPVSVQCWCHPFGLQDLHVGKMPPSLHVSTHAESSAFFSPFASWNFQTPWQGLIVSLVYF